MNDLPPPNDLRRAAFLLRLWRDEGQPDWRALLRPVPDGEPLVFANLEALHRHLQSLVRATTQAVDNDVAWLGPETGQNVDVNHDASSSRRC